MDKSKIEWTDATWNVIRGCEKVSPGCAHCYAETLVNGRLRGDFGTLQVFQGKLGDPIRWRRPRRIFVNSLSDLFWDRVPDQVIDQHFAAMALASQHQFQILTKRPDRMRAYVSDPERPKRVADAILSLPGINLKEHVRMATAMNVWKGLRLDDRPAVPHWPLPNVWLGTSTENQPMFDKRIGDLLATPAAVRFLSIEPLLGPMDIDYATRRLVVGPADVLTDRMVEDGWSHPGGQGDRPGVDWVIAGGESGAKARPMNPEWVRRLRDQCVAAGVPFFFKQWGEWEPHPPASVDDQSRFLKAHRFDEQTLMVRTGKRLAGRSLDGRLWDEVPKGR